MKKNLVEIKNISKSYGSGHQRIDVLKKVSFEIAEKDFLIVVGPSGAGKSTLLHLIGALDTPTAGEVFFEQKNVFALRDRARSQLRNEKVGFVFQFYHLLPEFTALENVAIPSLIYLRKKKFSKKEIFDKAQALLDQVGLSQRATHRPSQLSGGEQQRVAIARALMNDPQLLLADEPTGNLDLHTGQKIQELLVKLNEEKGCAMVVVTHDQNWSHKANRVLTMMDGNVYANLH